MGYLRELNDFVAIATQHAEPDADDLFGQSVAKQLKTFSEYQKNLAKLKIQQVLHDVLRCPEPSK